MSNSPLVTYSRPAKYKATRTHKIDTITIHCIVGQWTAKQGCDYFATITRIASANYVVGKDGSIGLSVEEKYRSYCTSSTANDNRAITIEVASDTTHPYKVTDAAYKALINLITDICERNGIEELKWKADKSLIGKVDKQNMTVHRWFAAKACPGDYLFNLHGQIAEEVNKRLRSASSEDSKETEFSPFVVRVETKTLNMRIGPSTSYARIGYIPTGAYTIVEVNGKWGRLKAEQTYQGKKVKAWIHLDYTKKV